MGKRAEWQVCSWMTSVQPADATEASSDEATGGQFSSNTAHVDESDLVLQTLWARLHLLHAQRLGTVLHHLRLRAHSFNMHTNVGRILSLTGIRLDGESLHRSLFEDWANRNSMAFQRNTQRTRSNSLDAKQTLHDGAGTMNLRSTPSGSTFGRDFAWTRTHQMGNGRHYCEGKRILRRHPRLTDRGQLKKMLLEVACQHWAQRCYENRHQPECGPGQVECRPWRCQSMPSRHGANIAPEIVGELHGTMAFDRMLPSTKCTCCTVIADTIESPCLASVEKVSRPKSADATRSPNLDRSVNGFQWELGI